MRIRYAVFDATGLTCSIGIAPNKLLSKICSDLEKPNGVTVLSMEEIPVRIWPLATMKINGIGPKASEKLTEKYRDAGSDEVGGSFGAATGKVQFRLSTLDGHSSRWL